MKKNKKRITLKVTKLTKKQQVSLKGGFHGSDFNDNSSGNSNNNNN